MVKMRFYTVGEHKRFKGQFAKVEVVKEQQ